jgi:Flp pilus assembly protein TadG
MQGWLEYLRRKVDRFRSNCSGNVALMFGISMVPLMVAIGTAVDYARVTNIRTKLNGAADFATLASVAKDSNPFVVTPTQATVNQYFNAIASSIPGLTITNVTSTIVKSTSGALTVTVSLNYTGQVKTVFGNFIGVNSVTVAGTSTAKTTQPAYIDFYLLLDNSPSMGLGATPADISQLQTLTGGCAFACHQHTFDSFGNITGDNTSDNTSDNYHIAKQNNVTVRIDVERTATQQLTQTATNTESQNGISNQFRMAVYTFSDTFQTIASLSSNMSTVSSNTSAVDLAYAYYNQRDAQTDFNTALTRINNIMPNPGNGTSSSSTEEFLFIVTDGVEDTPVGGNSGSGDPADTPLSYQPPNTQANVANSFAGNVNSGRLIDVIKSDSNSLCQTIKNRGITIAILYTPYQPVTNNAFYNQWVGATNTSVNNNNPVSSTDPTNPQSNGPGVALKACASAGFYFQVTPSLGISAAMQAMFQKAVNSVLLTQ